MVIMKALKPVFLDGRIIESGNTFSCSSEFSKRLIEGKSAELIVRSETVVTSNEIRTKILESKTKDELLKYAEENAIEGIDASNKKAEIIEAILKAAGSDEL